MSTCCRIQLCCDPPLAAAALAEHDGIPFTAAEKLLSGYQLVPREIPLGAETPADQAATAWKRLDALHSHIKAELREILPALGYPVKA